MLNIISLGAGVQSSTMALMAARGEIGPMPDAAVFADTGAEPKAVYEWLNWLEAELPFPVYRVSQGNLRDDIRNHVNTTGQRGFSAVPWFMRTVIPAGRKVAMLGDDDEVVGYYITTKEESRDGMGRRQCTAEYKLKPIRRKLRELAGLSKGARSKEIVVTQWIGISRDEIIRMKPSRDAWCQNRHPLIEMNITREGCLAWMAERQYPRPPRSACTFCPFHSNDEWRDLRDNQPKDWLDAIQVDIEIRNQPKIKAQQFAHASRMPLSDVDLRTLEDHGQMNMFNNECEGMCGV